MSPTDEQYKAMLVRMLQLPDAHGVSYSPEMAEKVAQNLVETAKNFSAQIKASYISMQDAGRPLMVKENHERERTGK
jgi:hypothetical protein